MEQPICVKLHFGIELVINEKFKNDGKIYFDINVKSIVSFDFLLLLITNIT